MFAEVADGAVREVERVFERGVAELGRRRRHHVLVPARTLVARPVVLRAQTVPHTDHPSPSHSQLSQRRF